MTLDILYALGFAPSSSCPKAWHRKGLAICRELGVYSVPVTVLWQETSKEVEVIVGNYECPTMLYCGPLHDEPQLQWLLQDFGTLQHRQAHLPWRQLFRNVVRRIGRRA